MSGLANLTLRQTVDDATAVIRTVFPEGGEPAGLKLAMVRALRQAETRGMQAIVEHFGICDDCSPVESSGSQLADATKKELLP